MLRSNLQDLAVPFPEFWETVLTKLFLLRLMEALQLASVMVAYLISVPPTKNVVKRALLYTYITMHRYLTFGR